MNTDHTPIATLAVKSRREHLSEVVRESLKLQRPVDDRSLKEKEVYGIIEDFLRGFAREADDDLLTEVRAHIYVEDDGRLYINLAAGSVEAAPESGDATKAADPKGGDHEHD